MATRSGYDTYRNSHYDGMDPKKLILMLYEGALKHIRLANEGIRENNIPKRGENLSHAIAIITELNACLDTNIKDESIDFLRGLYSAILTELPKVSLNNDIKILDRSETYISQLKEIWEINVMGKQRVIQTTERMFGNEKTEISDKASLKAGGPTSEYQEYNSRAKITKSFSA